MPAGRHGAVGDDPVAVAEGAFPLCGRVVGVGMNHVDKSDPTPLVVRWLITYGPDGAADEGLWGGRGYEPLPRVGLARRARGAVVGFAIVTIAAAVASVLIG